MGRVRPKTSWFQTLRRDSKLFAAVAVFSLFMGVLQPIAAAAAASPSDTFVICTTLGISEANGNSQKHPSVLQCPLCVTGHSCGFPIIANTQQLPPMVMAPVRLLLGASYFYEDFRFSERDNDPPPPIRGPPLPV